MTWNPMHGCSKYSAGCLHCYAETMANRLRGAGVKSYENGFDLTLNPDVLDDPKNVPFKFVDRVMETIELTPRHRYQLLTKRANLMHQYFVLKGYVPDNVWVGVTVEDERAKERMWFLKDIKETCCAPVTFLSCEPLLGDLGTLDLEGIDWVIVGGESGPQARPMRKEWVLNIMRQCKEQDVPFFFKQWGTWGEDGIKRDKKANGCTIDGEVYQEWPKAWKGGMK